MSMKLSKRLMTLASLVTDGFRLADVGTDHGYIPIFLVKEGRIPSAIAMDVREGPLMRAREHIADAGLEDKISVRLSDGVTELRDGEADTVLISGMGGGLVKKILSEGREVLTSVRELVLQPQSEIAAVRAWIRENGYVIVDEDMVKEDGKFYPMMKICHKSEMGTAEPVEEMSSDIADAFGPILLKKKHPMLLEWLNCELAVTEKILGQLNSTEEKEQIVLRQCELAEKKALLTEAMTYF